MLTTALLLIGAVLLALTLADRAVARLPLTPSVIYLAVGWLAGAALGAPSPEELESQASGWVVGTELAVLISLFAVGLRLRVPPSWKAWRVALLMAGPALVLTVMLGAMAAWLLLDLPWPAALLLAAIMAPTDPVLASEVQIHSETDRDAVRLSLTAEGGLNDGSALPAVSLALGLMGLGNSAPVNGMGPLSHWLWIDFAWPIGGGALLGVAVGVGVGIAISHRIRRGDRLARDELLYGAIVALAFGLARLTHTSTFVVVFAAGATLLWPLRGRPLVQGGQDLSDRLGAFGGRCERLVEATAVLGIGVALHGVPIGPAAVGFALLLVLVVRPLVVLAVVRRSMMSRSQRSLLGWFGIRGIGTLYYVAFAVQQGVSGEVAADLTGAALAAIAVSIVLHGVSATPLMSAYQRRRPGRSGAIRDAEPPP